VSCGDVHAPAARGSRLQPDRSPAGARLGRLSLDWARPHDVERHLADLDACDGEWPAGECRRWEPLSAVRTRASVVLDRYATYGRVLVVTHGTVIRALTGVRIGLGEIAAFERT
jgi:broad specificity phosphatase PhoE